MTVASLKMAGRSSSGRGAVRALWGLPSIAVAVLALTTCVVPTSTPDDAPRGREQVDTAPARALAADLAVWTHASARSQSPRLAAAAVIWHLNTLIDGTERWFDTLALAYPTSRDTNAEHMSALSAVREQVRAHSLALRGDPLWAARPQAQALQTHLDLVEALTAYEVDRVAMGALSSARYTELTQVHRRWRQALGQVQRAIMTGDLERSFESGAAVEPAEVAPEVPVRPPDEL